MMSGEEFAFLTNSIYGTFVLRYKIFNCGNGNLEIMLVVLAKSLTVEMMIWKLLL